MRRKMEIVLGGKTYEVSADFATIERIEQRFDIMSFLRSVQLYKPKIRDIAWVLYSAVKEAGHELSYNEIGDMVLDDMEGASYYAAQIVSDALGAKPEKVSKKKVDKGEQTDSPQSGSSTG